MGKTIDQWRDRTRARLGDLGVWQHIRPEQVPIAIEDALLTFSKDVPRIGEQTFAGNGVAFSFDLKIDLAAPPWMTDWSIVTEIEYPAGERIPELIETRAATVRNGVVTLHEVTPITGENIVIRYYSSWPFPTDNAAIDLVPEIYFQAVTALAGARLALQRGIELARTQSNSVAGQLYNTQPEPLFSAATALEKIYKDTVLGRGASAEEGAGASFPPIVGILDQDTFSDTLFHRREQLIE